MAHKKRLEDQVKKANLEPEEVDEEEQAQRQIESDLAKQAQQKKQEEEKKQREKAKTFSKDMNKGAWKPKTAVTVVDPKKKKKLKKLPTDVIQSPDEDDEEDSEPLPEGVCLQADSIHYINICQLEHIQAYLHRICLDLVPMVKQGQDVVEEYRKVVRSMYWACQAVGNMSLLGDVDPERVAGLVRDLDCVVWRQKLLGKDQAILKELLTEEEEDPQMAIENKEIEEGDMYGRIKT